MFNNSNGTVENGKDYALVACVAAVSFSFPDREIEQASEQAGEQRRVKRANFVFFF